MPWSAPRRAAPKRRYGDTINPATPPDWQETEAIALALLERTRDLRVMTHLAVARLHRSGVPGFADMLSQIRWQLENRWQQVHPQLDPEDSNDPTLRANALFRLRDPASVLRPLRDMPLAATPQGGTVCWRDIAVSRGALDPEPGRERRTEGFVRGVFQNTDAARMTTLRDAVDRAVAETAGIPAVFEAQAGVGTGPNFTDLAKLLGDIQKELQNFAVPAAVAPEEVSEPAQPVAATPGPAPVIPDERLAAPRAPASVRSISAVSSREDALYLLELAAAFFRTHEPSSPLPLLIDRAQRLARMEFLDILRDLAPDGLGQAENVAGRRSE